MAGLIWEDLLEEVGLQRGSNEEGGCGVSWTGAGTARER